jgi:hypothetical protein
MDKMSSVLKTFGSFSFTKGAFSIPKPAAGGGGGAFPVVESVNSGTTTGSNITVNLPSGVQNGDLLVCWIHANDNGTFSWPGTWTEEVDQDMTAFGGTGHSGLGIKVASGEGASITVTATTSDTVAWYIFRISGHNGYEKAMFFSDTDATGTGPNPPSLTPSWGAANTLWLALGAADNDPLTAGPANYTNFVAVSNVDANIGVARRNLNAATEDPGPFTIDNDEWCGVTVAVRPA